MFYSPEIASKRSITDNESLRPWCSKTESYCRKIKMPLCWFYFFASTQSQKKGCALTLHRVQHLIVPPVGGMWTGLQVWVHPRLHRDKIWPRFKSGHVCLTAWAVQMCRPHWRTAQWTDSKQQKATSREGMDPFTHGTHLNKYFMLAKLTAFPPTAAVLCAD